jgi:serpin B
MKPYTISTLFIISFILLLSGCNKDSKQAGENYKFKAEDASHILTKAEEGMVNDNAQFGFDVVKDIAKTEPSQSFVFSPLSATIALSMLEEGAEGETAREIARALGFEKQERTDINNFCRNMMVIANQSKDAIVSFANAILLNKNKRLTLNDSYLKTAIEYYDAECVSLDFSQESTLNHINNWASGKTNGLIPDLLPNINPGADAYLMDALYFKAAWQEPFSRTENDVLFRKEDGTFSKVQMMFNTNYFLYAESDDLQKLTLPYQGNAYSMDILLPRDGKTVQEIIDLLGTDEWSTLASSSEDREVIASVPSFASSSRIELTDILKSLGINKAFSNGDFSRLSPDDVSFDSAFQRANINVDQAGTEAAAITVIGSDIATPPGLEKPEPVVFQADKPFAYIIKHNNTNTALYIGVYMGD